MDMLDYDAQKVESGPAILIQRCCVVHQVQSAVRVDLWLFVALYYMHYASPNLFSGGGSKLEVMLKGTQTSHSRLVLNH